MAAAQKELPVGHGVGFLMRVDREGDGMSGKWCNRQARARLVHAVGLAVVVALGLMGGGCDREETPAESAPAQSPAQRPSRAPAQAPATQYDWCGVHFGAVPANPYQMPTAVRVELPEVPQAEAVWGGTGRDDRGHVWIGLCGRKTPGASARLLEYMPETGEMLVRGDVVSELARLGILREGESQNKIHTKILQADDGRLYFASTDIVGGDYEHGTRPPTWGGHLWRLSLPGNEWEHLLATPEGLIAITVSGPYVYALGFFGHKVYQYDIRTGSVRSAAAGSVDGHISRNIVSDRFGHVYVPRLRREPAPAAGPAEVEPAAVVSLVEYDSDLREVGATTLSNYIDQDPTNSHGLTGFQPMADGSIVIVTAAGYLYRIVPREGQAAEVKEIGWMHPYGKRYVASLFTYAGRRYVMGLSTGGKDSDHSNILDFEWVVYDLQTRQSAPMPFDVKTADLPSLRRALLYGSVTRDDAGRFYVVGLAPRGGPLVLRLDCSVAAPAGGG